MKKTLLTIATLALATQIQAIEPKWNLNGLALYEPNAIFPYKTAERDTIFIINSKTCSHCSSFNQELADLSDSDKAFINRNYYLTVVNIQESPKLKDIFKLRTTPSIYILDRDSRKPIDTIEGEPEINGFITYLKDVKRARK